MTDRQVRVGPEPQDRSGVLRPGQIWIANSHRHRWRVVAIEGEDLIVENVRTGYRPSEITVQGFLDNVREVVE